MYLSIDPRWVAESLTQFEQQFGRETYIEDWGALAAAVFRHSYELTAGEPFYEEVPTRAAILLQMFVVTAPLKDYNALLGSALAIRYMHESGQPIKPSGQAMADLASGFREGRISLREGAALLRSWVVS